MKPKKLPRQCATHPDYKTLVVALALKGRRITGRGGAQRNPCRKRDTIKKPRRADGKTMWRIGLTVRHTPAIVFVHRFVI
jgi:hypothetical protein